MKPWLFRISLSHLAQYPGRTILGILGIALGTAVYLSISLAAASALQSFQTGVTAVAGKAQWRIQTPGAALDEALFVKVRRLPRSRPRRPRWNPSWNSPGTTTAPSCFWESIPSPSGLSGITNFPRMPV